MTTGFGVIGFYSIFEEISQAPRAYCYDNKEGSVMKLKTIFFGRKVTTGVACFLAAVLMFGVVYYPAAVSVAGTFRQLPIYCVQRDQKVVSISFDAAWGDVGVRHIF